MSFNYDNALLAASAAYVFFANAYLIENDKRRRRLVRKRRSCWMKSLCKSTEDLHRNDEGSHKSQEEEEKEVVGAFEGRKLSGNFQHSFFGMSATDFDFLLNVIGPEISKMKTNMRKSISAKERLAVTLRYLTTGESFEHLCHFSKISPQSISNIVPEVCEALNCALNKDTIKFSRDAESWKKIAKDFYRKFNFPHCCGSLDGRQVIIQSPFRNGIELSSHQNRFSLVLLVAVDADYCFTLIDCECQSSINDKSVLRNTTLYRNIDGRRLNLPKSEPLLERKAQIPYVFVADDAFGLSPIIMKSYPGVHLKGSKERIFNYRLSRVRRIAENAFGVLASVFRILRKPLLLHAEKASLVTTTCVLLHNFLRKSETSRFNYTPCGTFDSEGENGDLVLGSWREDFIDTTSLLPLVKVPRKPMDVAQEIRNEFASYFMENGQIPWQNYF